ncbi:TadG family pilus assembly protein [Planctomicrobium piriforme]|uniref:von Willebrand factor type A domain-containing protein n=1 Tax=Planctomicrobium piriforme TaxID=1576369 RepID=A0A1I3C972_9PLAN|nr:TadG family pilus assembly protein [Planctomicrobium piriforme]SFH71078.1 von Willebrand factor type A domain-containing protein [Planctomicrobium piriforme]
MHRRTQNWLSQRGLSSRRGAIMVLTALLLVVIFGFTAFTVDVGYMNLLKGELQNAADAAAAAGAADLPEGKAAAIAAATLIGQSNRAAGRDVKIDPADIQLGLYDFKKKTFLVGNSNPNAVKVIARVKNEKYFFAPVLGRKEFGVAAEAIAMLNPRDIVFVIDASGSMNDDTEPAWATETINGIYGTKGYPGVASSLMQDLYSDFSFGSYPGTTQYVGYNLGITSDQYAYAEMTKDNGILTLPAIPTAYRIANTDSEAVRKQKAYSWIIDSQIAVQMPKALPTPSSAKNYAYWEKYLDYVIKAASVGANPPSTGGGGSGGGSSGGSSGGSGGGGSTTPKPTPPPGNYSTAGLSFEEMSVLFDAGERDPLFSERESNSTAGTLAYASANVGLPRNGSTLKVTLPPGQDGDRITGFNNPNKFTFSSASSSLPAQWQNRIGYLTYVQFMLDWGRDRSPDIVNGSNAAPKTGVKTPLSLLSSNCPMHTEATAGGSFSFPPREQPMHSARRSLIAALQVVKNQNAGLSKGAGDRVSIVSFDALDAYHQPALVMSLTDDYTAAMKASATLQPVSDIGSSTAIDAGLALARDQLKEPTDGGQGRSFATKVIVLLTDGVPNAWQSSDQTINDYITTNPAGDYYGSDYVWYNSALMQAAQSKTANSELYNVAVGLGADYDFMDRMARLSGTAENGQSPRGSGNPAEYEQTMTDIFTKIIKAPGSRLVD